MKGLETTVHLVMRPRKSNKKNASNNMTKIDHVSDIYRTSVAANSAH